MIVREKIYAQLQAKREIFRNFNLSAQNEFEVYTKALQEFAQLTSAQILEKVADNNTPGALPTSEFDLAQGLSLRFPPAFDNHEHARHWAHKALINHCIFAADGSQILPVNDFSIPVAAIQVAWFLNCHTSEGDYEKSATFEVLAPEELKIEYNGDRNISEQAVNLKRFELEIATLCGLIERIANNPKQMEKLPLALFDSSLVISFADRLQGEQRDHYVALVLRLLRCSEAARVPLIGYVDTSYSKDLTHLLENCFSLPESSKIHDAQLVNHLLQWGDRTPLFVCARGSADKKQEGVLESFEEYKRGLGFTYLKTHSEASPARLEVPLWIQEQGLLDEVINLIRAEVVVGNGYPYVLESADAAAVITARDRSAFYAIFQKFAEDEAFELKISQKAVSKNRRR